MGGRTWISCTNSQLEINSDVESVFENVRDNPCSLISIFGKAREGKSFLMNCIAEQDIFAVSSGTTPCTKGVNICPKIRDMSDFPLRNPNELADPSEIRIGFADVEGQGYHEDADTTKLISTTLLLSKCAIFNWRGGFLVNEILNTLGVHAAAANNVETRDNTRPFGHLHIVLRDYQASETDSGVLYHSLMDLEGANGGTRDSIRQLLLRSFLSIRIWMFDTPAMPNVLRTNSLSLSNASIEFREQVSALRLALRAQLQEPTVFANRPLTGGNIFPISRSLVTALNDATTIIPADHYVNYVHAKAAWLNRKLDADLANAVSELIGRLHGFGLAADDDQNQGDADTRFTEAIRSIQEAYVQRFESLIQNEASDTNSTLAHALSASMTDNQRLLIEQQKARFRADTQQMLQSLLRNVLADLDFKKAEVQKLIQDARRKNPNALLKLLRFLAALLYRQSEVPLTPEQLKENVANLLEECNSTITFVDALGDTVVEETDKSMVKQKLGEIERIVAKGVDNMNCLFPNFAYHVLGR